MHRSALVVSVLSCAIAFALPGCSADADPAGSSELPGEASHPILGGKKAKSYPEAALVDLLEDGEVVAACSGAVIAPRVVLTAGHCVHGFTRWHVRAPYAGAESSAIHGAVLDWTSDSDEVDPAMHDIGLVFLASKIVLDAYPRIADAPLPAGARVRNIGRIDDGELSDTDLFVSSQLAIGLGSSAGYPFDYVANQKIEHGDSGGPDVLPGPAPHTIVGVNSGGGGGIELLARVDLVRAWILSQIEAHGGKGAAGPSPACGHDPCAEGKKLSAGCDPCVETVCNGDAYCCKEAWDEQCVGEAESACSTCP